MSPIATTSDAAPNATPKRARSETVFGSPRRLPRRNRFARKAGTFTSLDVTARRPRRRSLVLPLLPLHLPRATFLGHVDDAVLGFAVLLAAHGQVGRVAFLDDLQDLNVRRGHHLDHLHHLLRVRIVEVLRLLFREELAERPEVLLLHGLEEV